MDDSGTDIFNISRLIGAGLALDIVISNVKGCRWSRFTSCYPETSCASTKPKNRASGWHRFGHASTYDQC